MAPGDETVPAGAEDLSLPVPAPAIAELPRRLRIAMCVSGQLRGYGAAFPTWDNLGLDRHDTTYFVHVWKDVGHNWQRMWVYVKRNPFLFDTFVRSNGIPFLQSRYPRMIDAALRFSARHSEANERDLRDFYNTPHVVVEDDREERFLQHNNFWKMHYKIGQAHRLAKERGGEFDLMIRFRPDREISEAQVDWHETYWRSRTGRALFADEAYVYTERVTWLADQFAAGVPEVMDVYAEVFADFDNMLRTQRAA